MTLPIFLHDVTKTNIYIHTLYNDCVYFGRYTEMINFLYAKGILTFLLTFVASYVHIHRALQHTYMIEIDVIFVPRTGSPDPSKYLLR